MGKNVDIFAAIANEEHIENARKQALITPPPPTLSDKVITSDAQPHTRFTPYEPIATEDALAEEVARLTHVYAPFMEDHAPRVSSPRVTLPLAEFDFAIRADNGMREKDALANLTWERVTIPHYGAPLGRKVTYYRTRFTQTDAMRALPATYIRFAGVDYAARVFVNDEFVGEHEGFFAPFEFDVTHALIDGENTLLVRVENDYTPLGSEDEEGGTHDGVKLYAATGPGYDDPVRGWHHCPAGMGIYHDVIVEARNDMFISDVFARPLVDERVVEVYVSVTNRNVAEESVTLSVSLYGKNFKCVIIEDDVFPQECEAGRGVNRYPLRIDIPNARLWTPDEPWLYTAQVALVREEGGAYDSASVTFGMRSFRIDETSEPKGALTLNGAPIRLRGANTMGYLQQDVMAGDMQALLRDLLLGKACNMNALRITQRPVQSVIYDYCDMLGIMVQTDLPLFGVIPRVKTEEVLRQAGEMERLIRNHAACVIVSYINEPFRNARGRPHRGMLRDEMEALFDALTIVTRSYNPDRQIKPIDGDYDPPGPGLPDNHCYAGWYNAHGLDLGRLHKGWWINVKDGWHYACGEFGAEGLEAVSLMRARYPKEWLPQTDEEERTWQPYSIVKAQSGAHHNMWYETPATLEEWVASSQEHQAFVIDVMTSAFRRDRRMVSFAIHLFIDAFPSGWMKTIIDCERRPKRACFVYRDLLSPRLANLRSDRSAYFANEEACVEAWVCNDGATPLDGYRIAYYVSHGDSVISSGAIDAACPPCESAFQGYITFSIPNVVATETLTLFYALLDEEGDVVHGTRKTFTAAPRAKAEGRVAYVGDRNAKAHALIALGGVDEVALDDAPDVIFIADYDAYCDARHAIDAAVELGARAVLTVLDEGTYSILDEVVETKELFFYGRHHVSRDTGHRFVRDIPANALKFLYDEEAGYVTPFAHVYFQGDAWDAVLASGTNTGAPRWERVHVAGERRYGKGAFILNTMEIANRAATSPWVARYVAALLSR